MPKDKAKRPLQAPRLIPQVVGDPKTARAIGDIAGAVTRIEGQRAARAVLEADLAVGANTMVHGLGRTPAGCHVTPTIAAAGFAWALTNRNEKTLTITIVGTAQAGATVEVF